MLSISAHPSRQQATSFLFTRPEPKAISFDDGQKGLVEPASAYLPSERYPRLRSFRSNNRLCIVAS
jgi:hypothetical protein